MSCVGGGGTGPPTTLSEGKTGPGSHSRCWRAQVGPTAPELPPRPPQARHLRPPACPPGDSAPSPGTTGLWPLPASYRDPSKSPRMQGARAPRGQGQAPSAVGALGRPGVLLLTYVLTALDLTCLFMQFSVLPVSTPSRRPPGCTPAHSSSTCAPAGRGGLTPRDPLAGGPCHTGAGGGTPDHASWHPISTSWALAAQSATALRPQLPGAAALLVPPLPPALTPTQLPDIPAS